MTGQGSSWDRNAAELARQRRRLARQGRRARRKAPPEPVEPGRARRRARVGLGIVCAAWAAGVLTDALLIRAHVLRGSFLLSAGLCGYLAADVGLLIWYGAAGRVGVCAVRGGQGLSARTLTGVRTIELDSLAQVRRFVALGRSGTPSDELRLRDRHGLRLTIDRDRLTDDCIRRVIQRAEADPGAAPIAVTRHARVRLRLAPRSADHPGLYQVLGMLAVIGSALLPAVGSYVLAALLA